MTTRDDLDPRPASEQRSQLFSRRALLATGAVLGSIRFAGACAGTVSSSGEDRTTPNLPQTAVSDVETLARRIEETPREKVFELVAGELRKGVPERVFEAALLLAAVRNVNPRPCGFKLHCVFVLHAAHVLSAMVPHEERLLAWFWALDYVKQAQADDVARGDFRMAEWKGAAIAPERAGIELAAAMQAWDDAKAEAAIVSLWRSRPSLDVFESLWEHGARDFRNLAHKAIYAANLRRTLELVGTDHAEPALRSLVSSLLYLGRDGRSNGYAFEDQCYLGNVERATKALPSLPASWIGTGASPAAVRELTAAMLAGDAGAASEQALSALSAGEVRALDVWDAVHLAAGEMVMRSADFNALHANTAANALHYAFRASRVPRTRLLLLLQGVGWQGQFAALGKFNGAQGARIFELQGVELPRDPTEASAQILAHVTDEPALSARMAFACAEREPDVSDFLRAASRVVVAKAGESHSYKFPAALFEDCAQVSPRWRPHLLAASTSYLCGSTDRDSEVVLRSREVLRGV